MLLALDTDIILFCMKYFVYIRNANSACKLTDESLILIRLTGLRLKSSKKFRQIVGVSATNLSRSEERR